MALKATIFKAAVTISDLDRNYFDTQWLTLARHPSETDERMMLRLFAWCCYADRGLSFTRGLSADNEPELWKHHDHGTPELWIELGLPDEKRLKKAVSLASQVVLFTYNSRPAQGWRQQNIEKLRQQKNLTIWYIDDEQLKSLAGLVSRNMDLQVTLQEGIIWFSDNKTHLEIRLEPWLMPNKS